MSDDQQFNPDWITAPYTAQGVADLKMMALIEERYPPPKYKVTKNGPDNYGFYFYSVEEQSA